MFISSSRENNNGVNHLCDKKKRMHVRIVIEIGSRPEEKPSKKSVAR